MSSAYPSIALLNAASADFGAGVAPQSMLALSLATMFGGAPEQDDDWLTVDGSDSESDSESDTDPDAVPIATLPFESIPAITRLAATSQGTSFNFRTVVFNRYVHVGISSADKDPRDSEIDRLKREIAEITEKFQAHMAAPSTAPADTPRCNICIDAPANSVAVECGHAFACAACSSRMAECAMCRKTTKFVTVRY